MNKNYIALSLTTLLSLGVISTSTFAELKLPSGADRRPNLSLDPFERAREAMRNLPKAQPEESPKPVEAVTEPDRKDSGQNPGTTLGNDIIKQAATETTKESQAETSFLGEQAAEAFSYEFAITMDAFSLTSGGLQEPEDENTPLKKTGVIGIVDFIAEVDTAAAGLWDNGLFFLYTALTFGKGPTVGDLHGISSIDAGGDTMHIMELWYEHSFPYSRSSAIFGIHDFNGDFYVAEYANLFVNAGFGFGQAIGDNAGPSNYPNTTLGIRLKSEVTENSYFQIAMYDGAVGTDDESAEAEFNKIISVKLDKNEGVFVGAEGGIFKNEPGSTDGYYKLALGLWYLRADQEGFDTPNNDPEGNPIPVLAGNPRPGTGGAYILGEMSIGEKMGIFFKHGRARSEYLQHSQFYSAGMNFTGAIPGRDEDVLGIGLVYTANSPEYMAQFEEGALYKAETTYEITYTAQITDWLMVQPDFQYVQYPNMDPNIVKASVIGVRAQAVF